MEGPKMNQGMIHVINGLGKLSGAEKALLRVASKQSIRPLTIVSMMDVNRDQLGPDWPDDIELVALKHPFGLPFAVVRLRRFLASRGKSTVVCWMYRSNIAGALACMFRNHHRLIWNIRHSLTELGNEPRRVRISIALNRLLSWMPKKILYVSDRSRQQHEEQGFPAAKSAYVPNGFAEQAEPSAKQRKPGPFVFGHAGRLTWEKDIDTLLHAFSRAKANSNLELKLLMAGPGYDLSNPELREVLNRYGLDDGSVVAVGRVSDMRAFYASLDVFVLSSVSEGFPNVLAEALLTGTPCITTDVGDASLIVSSNCGWVVPSRDPETMSQAIQKAASLGAAELQDLGKAGFEQTTERYSLKMIARKYDDLGANDA